MFFFFIMSIHKNVPLHIQFLLIGLMYYSHYFKKKNYNAHERNKLLLLKPKILIND